MGKNARGTDGRIYPWGNNAPDNTLLNYNLIVGDTTEVGIFPNGASSYGVLDMVGNVEQWVNDWYQSDYYATLSNNATNPQGSCHWRCSSVAWRLAGRLRKQCSSCLSLQREPSGCHQLLRFSLCSLTVAPALPDLPAKNSEPSAVALPKYDNREFECKFKIFLVGLGA